MTSQMTEELSCSSRGEMYGKVTMEKVDTGIEGLMGYDKFGKSQFY